ncbi:MULTISPECIES: hypothetical protein [unclassified Arthrobacter]|uniref:hypothetical protein n=1 Tax=unclassified Arthrobacter TaxID=235627 RepID=UPI00088255B6|nr:MULTISPECIES: hypothetical protein [unclassified Arthrobacter]BCW72830.1 hypothetical protein NicSoilB8_38740 [Arthrobacter sp. NicSoilB8]SDP51999.1 hypothetical protein SAMN04487914_114106 [Arthrobacter sp. ok909]
MTFETANSVTHKLWDRSTMHHELDALIHDLSERHNTPKSNIAVHASGPGTFTLSLNHGAANLEAVSA